MAAHEAILSGVEWAGGFTPPEFAYDDNLRGLVSEAQVAGSGLQMVLFRAVARGDAADQTATVGWDNLPEGRRTLPDNAKGTGIYTATTPRGVGVFADSLGDEGETGVYLSPDIQYEDILDMRDGDPAKLWPYLQVFGRHLGHRALERLTTAESVVRSIDESYGDARAVLLTMGPTLALKERLRRGPLLSSEDPPGWVLWRDPQHPLRRVGTVRVPRT